MNNKVVNKQISLETIVKVANHLEDYKEKYDRKFELEQNRNKNIPYGEKQWEFENGNTTINYTIEFKNGKNWSLVFSSCVFIVPISNCKRLFAAYICSLLFNKSLISF